MRKHLTLCIVHQHPRLLLGMKKRGFGAGRWNGFGGKVAESESIEAAARRELLEECGIEASYMEKAGILHFDFQDDPSRALEVHVFRVIDFSGEPTETEEMRPQWFHFDEIPFKEMWRDDIYWMPLFLKQKKFRGRFLFDKPATAEHPGLILERDLAIVDDLDE